MTYKALFQFLKIFYIQLKMLVNGSKHPNCQRRRHMLIWKTSGENLQKQPECFEGSRGGDLLYIR